MGLILNLIAELIKWIICPFAYIFGCIYSAIKGDFNRYNRDIAISKDQYGNVVGQYLFNLCLIKKYGFKFGDPDMTISYVLGMNKKDKTLTDVGRFICSILNLLEKNHVEKAIEKNQ